MNKYTQEPSEAELLALEKAIENEQQYDFDFIPDRLANTGFYVLHEMGSIPQLSEEETRELAILKDKGNDEARTKLIESNLRLVAAVAKKFVPINNPIFSDLFQEGSIGLSIAVDKYDYRKGCRLSTYAVWWIRQSILRSFANDSRVIRIAVHSHDAIIKLQKISDNFLMKHGYTPSNKELSDMSGIAEDEITLLFNANSILSLNAHVADGDGDTEFGDFIPEDFSIDEIAERNFLKENLLKAIKAICHDNPRRIEVLIERFGLDGSEEKTLDEIAKKYGVTREWIRQIEYKAIKEIKENKAFEKRFKDFN